MKPLVLSAAAVAIALGAAAPAVAGPLSPHVLQNILEAERAHEASIVMRGMRIDRLRPRAPIGPVGPGCLSCPPFGHAIAPSTPEWGGPVIAPGDIHVIEKAPISIAE